MNYICYTYMDYECNVHKNIYKKCKVCSKKCKMNITNIAVKYFLFHIKKQILKEMFFHYLTWKWKKQL